MRKDETDANTIYTQTFSYDANGNRLQLVKTGTIGNETINYTYNAADQIVQQAIVGGATTTYSFDANGNMIQKSDGVNTYTYGYDYENRLISFDAPGTMNDASYVYAIDSWERLSKTVDGTTMRYLRDGANVLAEYDANNTLIATYLEGLGMDEHISKTIGANVYRYLTDHLVSVRQLIDSSQAVQNSYDYSSFGEVLGTLTENVSNAYRFTGRTWDSEASSQYHRSRAYYPNIGRWATKDPERFAGGQNLYSYVGNSPVVFTDGDGLRRIIVIPAIPPITWTPIPIIIQGMVCNQCKGSPIKIKPEEGGGLVDIYPPKSDPVTGTLGCVSEVPVPKPCKPADGFYPPDGKIIEVPDVCTLYVRCPTGDIKGGYKWECVCSPPIAKCQVLSEPPDKGWPDPLEPPANR